MPPFLGVPDRNMGAARLTWTASGSTPPVAWPEAIERLAHAPARGGES
jgi:hypothetical protein